MRLCVKKYGVRHECVRTIDVEWIVSSGFYQTDSIMRTPKEEILTTDNMPCTLIEKTSPFPVESGLVSIALILSQ